MSTTVRPLTATEHRALTAARLVAIERAPYFAHVLFRVQPVAAPGLGTFAVDEAWRLYLDPDTLHAWGPSLAGGVLVHEAGHLVRGHAARAQALGPNRDHVRWNYACDAAINDDLVEAAVPLPDGVVTPAALGLAPGGIEEAYYAALAPQTDDGSTGCGSGAGDPRAAWELPAGDPAAPGVSAADATIARRRTAEAVRDHAATGRGTTPAGLRRWAEQALSTPTVNWRRQFGSSVRRAVAYVNGLHDYTYSRPGRRRIPGVITPAMRRPVITVAVLIDTSASMSRSQLAAALSECQGVLAAAGISERNVAILTCDAALGAVSRVRRATDIKLIGGGGTDMRVGITAATKLRPRPDVIVVLTDGYTPWPAAPTRARLIVGIIGTPAVNGPSWARTVHIPTDG